MKAADLAHISNKRPIGPDRLTGEPLAEWNEIVRLWAAGKLRHLTIIYLHQWAQENCGITLGRSHFTRCLHEQAAKQRDIRKGEGQLNAEQDSPKEPAKADRAKGHRTGRRRRPAR